MKEMERKFPTSKLPYPAEEYERQAGELMGLIQKEIQKN